MSVVCCHVRPSRVPSPGGEPASPKQWVSAREACDLLDCSKWVLHRLAAERKITTLQVSMWTRYLRADVERLLEESITPAAR